MRLKFNVSISSGQWGSYGPDEEGEVPEDEAKRLIVAGIAEPVDTGPAKETATKKRVITRRAKR
ncbi:hypothetical protein LCGC14_0972250 [marine sediment metagenome]|uniref:Uncharacterized protein n=1 Tax=marine sediment metagenome TaxID=412755 RepID=A0A0F9NBC9_9ZZZZ